MHHAWSHALALPARPHALSTVHHAWSHSLSTIHHTWSHALALLLAAPGTKPALALWTRSLALAGALLLGQDHTAREHKNHCHCGNKESLFHGACSFVRGPSTNSRPYKYANSCFEKDQPLSRKSSSIRS
ncbi:MAG: hypothetical protein R6U55_01150 [Desulfovermiculus sp.]